MRFTETHETIGTKLPRWGSGVRIPSSAPEKGPLSSENAKAPDTGPLFWPDPPTKNQRNSLELWTTRGLYGVTVDLVFVRLSCFMSKPRTQGPRELTWALSSLHTPRRGRSASHSGVRCSVSVQRSSWRRCWRTLRTFLSALGVAFFGFGILPGVFLDRVVAPAAASLLHPGIYGQAALAGMGAHSARRSHVRLLQA